MGTAWRKLLAVRAGGKGSAVARRCVYHTLVFHVIGAVRLSDRSNPRTFQPQNKSLPSNNIWIRTKTHVVRLTLRLRAVLRRFSARRLSHGPTRRGRLRKNIVKILAKKPHPTGGAGGVRGSCRRQSGGGAGNRTRVRARSWTVSTCVAGYWSSSAWLAISSRPCGPSLADLAGVGQTASPASRWVLRTVSRASARGWVRSRRAV